MTSRALRTSCGLLLLTLAACQTSKSSNPTAPTVAGPIPGVNISAPVLLEPAQGFKFKESEQPIRLVVQNATTNGVRPLSYVFEVATDSGFASKVFSRSNVAPGGDNRTSIQLDRLDIGRAYFWRAWAEDGANTGVAASAGFEIFPKPAIGAPGPVSPINNELVGATTTTLRVTNSTWEGPVGNFGYEFQVARDQAFAVVVAAGIVGEVPGQTSFNTPPLPGSATLFWRSRASDGETTSAWSPTQSFRTPAAPAPPPPPGPGPAPTPGAPCVSGNPEAIVSCERAKFGHMNSSQIVTFLRNVARSLNANGIADGPFGILRKGSGASCNGYSCDIICAGNGGGQRQYDVLGDAEGAQTPGWAGPHTLPHIRVDVCEIQ
jgi:hypothetical protein